LRRHPVTALVLAAAALALPANAAAQTPSWATVNVCDSAASPNQVGVRASVPGSAARFTIQWLNPRSNAWVPVDGVPSSPWLSAETVKQVGWTFQFDQPPPGSTFQLRGVAELKSGSLVTSGGLAGVDAGDPAGTSLATCTLR
jgi:hypothetical protein